MTPLEKARKARNLSQRQLSKLSGINQSAISRGERGVPMGRRSSKQLVDFFGGAPFDEMHFMFPDRFLEIAPDIQKAS